MNNVLQEFIEKTSLNNGEKEYFNFHQYRYRLISKILFFLLERGEQTGRELLDVGSAYLHISSLASMMGYRVKTLDLKEFTETPWLKRRALEYGIDSRQCDLSKEKIPWPDNFFDVIVFSETLEHFNFNAVPVIQEIYRVLKSGGNLVLTTPNLFRLGNKIRFLFNRHIYISLQEPPGGHWREYSALELEMLMKLTGFKNFKVSYFNYDIPTDSYLSRMVKKFMTFVSPSLAGNLLVEVRK